MNSSGASAQVLSPRVRKTMLVVGDREQAVRGDGDAVGVAAEVAEDLPGPPKGCLA